MSRNDEINPTVVMTRTGANPPINKKQFELKYASGMPWFQSGRHSFHATTE
ncbi:hypothetical protein NEA10_17440 [Phormidium yuhuli AB48]|uniref:Uncharacterized protein n=1 Tax=Phormidium yuhuli AB48 TaxID=2940671 RepID=A0ABY5ANV2_9CYAN|nr:hypothetical protein [Phormidium yuhuli]USR90593.1 hypothetical protein NEA10_17440 [Phormidium yuhuli AB48]